MSTWQENLKEDKKIVREMHQYYLETHARVVEIRDLVNQFDRASEDKTKLEIAGRLISLVQKVML